MADKRIDQLTAASTMNSADLLVLEQNGTAKKLSGETLGDFLCSNVVDISDTQPESIANKIWITPSSEEYELVEKSELDALADSTTTIELDNSILNPCLHLVASANDNYIRFYSAADPLYLDTQGMQTTQMIPVPTTKDGKIYHNGYGTSSYYAIMFFNSAREYISGAENGTEPTEPSVATDIPNGAAYFVVSSMRGAESFPKAFKVKMILTQTEYTSYLLKLANFIPTYRVISLIDSNTIWYDKYEINPSTGEETYSANSNYSVTDFIKIPDNLFFQKLAQFAYSGSSKSRRTFYDANKTFISGAASTTKRIQPADIPSGAKYFKLSTHTPAIPKENCRAYVLQKVTSADYYLSDFMVDENSSIGG